MRRSFILAITIVLAFFVITDATATAKSVEKPNQLREISAANMIGSDLDEVEMQTVLQQSDMPSENVLAPNEERKINDEGEARTTNEPIQTTEHAVIEQDRYVIHFFDYDGTEIVPLRQELYDGERVKEPEWAPMHKDMAFLYWFDEQDELFAPFQFAWEYARKDMSLVARYELLPSFFAMEPERIPNGFFKNGISGNPNLPNENRSVANDDSGEKVAIGQTLSDGHWEGTVIDSRKGSGFTVAIISIDGEIDAEGMEDDTEEEPDVDEQPNEEEKPDVDEQPDEEEEPDENEKPDGEEVPSEGDHGDVFVALGEQRAYQFGETVTLAGSLEGLEDAIELTFQWQYSVDGENWTDIKDATSLSYSFVCTEENQHYKWRLEVFVAVPTTEEGAGIGD